MIKLLIIAILFSAVLLFTGIKNNKNTVKKIGLNFVVIPLVYILAASFGPAKYQVDLNTTVSVNKEKYYLGWNLNRVLPFASLAQPVLVTSHQGNNVVTKMPEDLIKKAKKQYGYQAEPFFKQYAFLIALLAWYLIQRRLFKKKTVRKTANKVTPQEILASNDIGQLETWIEETQKRSMFRVFYKRKTLALCKNRLAAVKKDYAAGFYGLMKSICNNRIEKQDYFDTQNTRTFPLWVAEQILLGQDKFAIEVNVKDTIQSSELSRRLPDTLVERIQNNKLDYLEASFEKRRASQERDNFSGFYDDRNTEKVSNAIKSNFEQNILSTLSKFSPKRLIQFSTEASLTLRFDIYRARPSGDSSSHCFMGLTRRTDDSQLHLHSHHYYCHIQLVNGGRTLDESYMSLQQCSLLDVFQALVDEKGDETGVSFPDRKEKAKVLSRLNSISRAAIGQSLIVQNFGAMPASNRSKSSIVYPEQTESILQKAYLDITKSLNTVCKDELTSRSIDLAIETLYERYPELVERHVNKAVAQLVELGVGQDIIADLIGELFGDIAAELISNTLGD